jgi:uncharacterized protein (UPF0332 family)
VSPEAALYLEKANEGLAKAHDMLPRWPDEAGWATCLAGLHAAQAFIVESTGKQIKSHRGVQRELSRLTKEDPGFGLGMRAFLGQTYNLKAIADYETGPGSKVSPERAAKAIAESELFVARLTRMVEAGRSISGSTP